MQNNIPAVVTLIQYIYETIMYAELNTKSDYCEVCGFDGEIQIVEDKHGKLVWKCPNCGIYKKEVFCKIENSLNINNGSALSI